MAIGPIRPASGLGSFPACTKDAGPFTRWPMELKNKVAIVTGASRGIGEAVARSLAEAGAQVVLASRKPEGLATVEARFKDAGHEVFTPAVPHRAS